VQLHATFVTSYRFLSSFSFLFIYFQIHTNYVYSFLWLIYFIKGIFLKSLSLAAILYRPAFAKAKNIITHCEDPYERETFYHHHNSLNIEGFNLENCKKSK